MPRKSRSRKTKKYFTVAEANASLPLVRAIVRDITELASRLRDRKERLARLDEKADIPLSDAHAEELEEVYNEVERDRSQLREYVDELTDLGIELKDINTGLIDFPCWKDEREICLCWRYGEQEIAHWHELDAGFAGRQPLMIDAMTS